MLNAAGERELAYVVKIDSIEPIVGSDHCEAAVVGGWRIMTRKGTFQPGSLAIYFEIDSQVDISKPEFAFMSKYKGHVKTQKYTFGGKNPGFYSQGLLMSAEDFGGISYQDGDGQHYLHFGKDSYFKENIDFKVGDFLTKRLEVTYYVAEDNKRKASVNPDARINAALGRHPKIAKKWGRFIKKHRWAKFLFLLFFGRSKKKSAWPNHIAARTDVERIQNMMYILQDKTPYVASEKIDGSSCSIMAERTKFGKIKYYVCSRNVVFEDENQSCFYDSNIYFEIYNKYNLKDKITRILNDYNLPNVALQLEVYGEGVQKRDYSIKGREGMVFHIVSNGVKFPMDKVVEICEKYDIPHVPIVNDNFIFPDTLDELKDFVEGEGSKIDGKPREGIVFYDKETGQRYTKFVSPAFLIRYHQ